MKRPTIFQDLIMFKSQSLEEFETYSFDSPRNVQNIWHRAGFVVFQWDTVVVSQTSDNYFHDFLLLLSDTASRRDSLTQLFTPLDLWDNLKGTEWRWYAALGISLRLFNLTLLFDFNKRVIYFNPISKKCAFIPGDDSVTKNHAQIPIIASVASGLWDIHKAPRLVHFLEFYCVLKSSCSSSEGPGILT